MHDLRRIPAIACVILVTLRLFIGWHLFYEGMWKYQTMGTANAWSAEGYLKNAQGPFRDQYRAMVGDPDGLDWLDYDKVAAKWDAYGERFATHYGLDDKQRGQLDALINGQASITSPLTELPEGVVWPEKPVSKFGKELASVVSWDGKQLTTSAATPPKPSEIAWAKSLVKIGRTANGQYSYEDSEGNTTVNADISKLGASDAAVNYYKTLDRLETLVARGLGYKNRARASLVGDPERRGVTGVLRKDKQYIPEMKTTKAQDASIEATTIVYGDIQVYKDLLAEYESYMQGDSIEFRQDHAKKIAQKVQEKFSEVVVPIVNLDKDLKTAAIKLLTPEQFAKGALPPEKTSLYVQSSRAMYGLIVLGGLLILGLFTRLAAAAAAVMLLSFYLVWPPWPGVPVAPGPEHSFIINKNLIEATALVALACMPTGTWFGIDGVFYRLFRKKPASQPAS